MKQPRILYVAEYKCGCIAESTVKRELLEYCAKHGDDRRYLHRFPNDAQPVVPPSSTDEVRTREE